MIGLDGYYLLTLTVGKYKDFLLNSDQLSEFTIIEVAGNLLPTFQAKFITDIGISKYLSEKNALKVQFGKNLNSLMDIEFLITKSVITKVGGNNVDVSIAGILNANKYVAQPVIKIYPKCKFIDALKSCVSGIFKVDTNVSGSESQNWIQHNITPKKFINDNYLNMDLGDSFPAIAITANRVMIVKDIKKSLKGGINGHQFKLTPEGSGEDGKEVYYKGDYIDESNAGLINNWLGYGRKTVEYNLSSGVESTFNTTTKNLLALNNSIPKDVDIDARFGGLTYSNDNVHSNYNLSRLNNITKLAVFSSIRITVSNRGSYFGVKPLDVIMFVDKNPIGGLTDDIKSGLYICSKVSRTISGSSFNTTLQLVRESHNK